MHGPDAYANKKHKGNNGTTGSGPGQHDGGGSGGMSAASSPPSSFDVKSEQRTSSTPISPASSGTPPSSDDATKSPTSKPNDHHGDDSNSGLASGQQHDLNAPISDDLVTSTCAGSVEAANDWYAAESINMASPDPVDLMRSGPYAISVGAGGGDDIGCSSPMSPPSSVNITLKGGRSTTPSFRSRIKSGLKTATNWIPNMFNGSKAHVGGGMADNRRPQDAKNNAKNKKEQKPLLVRQNSTASNSNHSYYSSVLGSDGNSFGSNGGGGGGHTQASCFEMKPLSVSQAGLNRCASYDPISLGGSSRRSSSTSLASSAAAGPTIRTPAKRGSARHLSQTDNLVIVPQSVSLSLSSDGYGSSISTLDSAAGSFTGPMSDSGSNSTTMTVATQVSTADAQTHMSNIEMLRQKSKMNKEKC